MGSAAVGQHHIRETALDSLRDLETLWVARSFWQANNPVWIYLPVGSVLDACGVGVFGTQSLSGPAELW
jgi:hypothetical protein